MLRKVNVSSVETRIWIKDVVMSHATCSGSVQLTTATKDGGSNWKAPHKQKQGEGGGDFGGFTPPSPRFWDLQDLWIMEYVDTTQIIHTLIPSIDTYLYITELSATH